MRAELHPAFVLHTRTYRETSLLIEVLSSRYGRVGLIAKGANRPRAALRGVLQVFRPLLVAWTGRGDLATLIGAEFDGTPITPLAGRRLLCGFYLNEVLMRVLARHDPHPRLFERYAAAVPALAQVPNEETVLRAFEKHLLQELGYALQLDHEIESNAPIEPDTVYYYQCDKGPWRNAPGAVPTLGVHGRTLLALAAEHWNGPQDLRESKRLMRFALAPHLGDRPLASRALFRNLEAG
ncbi:MAG: DNA repair protein RecO [Gammaproteobacteria bacterium]